MKKGDTVILSSNPIIGNERAVADHIRRFLEGLGMEVHEDCTLIAEVEGRVYRFCSEGCRRKFLDERAKGTTRLGYDLVICALQGMALNMLRHRATEPSEAFFRYLEERVDELARGEPVAEVARSPASEARN